METDPAFVPGKVSSANPANKPSEFYDDLLRLEDLRKKGILTDAEFKSAKKRVLDRVGPTK